MALASIPAVVWSLSHLLFIAAITLGRCHRPLVILCLFSLLLSFILKRPTYDLNVYTEMLSSVGSACSSFEIGFASINCFLISLSWTPTAIVGFWGVKIFILLFCAATVLGRRDFFTISCIILLSVFFVLASQNILRQGVSLAYIGLALALFISDKKILSIGPAAASLIFHHAAVLFFIITTAFVFYSTITKSQKMVECFGNPRQSIRPYSLFGLVVGSAVLMGISFAYYVPYSIYLDPNQFVDGRYSSAVKMIAVAAIFGTTELILRKVPAEPILIRVRQFRGFVFALLLPLSTLPEFFARCLVLYFLAEVLLAFVLAQKTNRRLLSALSVILLSYAVAPNALKIMGFI